MFHGPKINLKLTKLTIITAAKLEKTIKKEILCPDFLLIFIISLENNA